MALLSKQADTGQSLAEEFEAVREDIYERARAREEDVLVRLSELERERTVLSSVVDATA
jgi:PHD/YefM family antitoxin component YafN of YafNO toxin-antitoxin module